MTVTYRGISFRSSSNNEPSSPPHSISIKRKAAPEEKYNTELTVGIGDDSNYSPLVIDDYLKMGDIKLRLIGFGMRY